MLLEELKVAEKFKIQYTPLNISYKKNISKLFY